MAIALRYAARSDLGLGPKSRNEDSGYAGPHLLVLADGMGGHAAGDVASSMIVGHLAPLDDEAILAEQALQTLARALAEANDQLSAAMEHDASLSGMGSTTIVMLRTGNKIAMAHIGDSRAYVLRDGVVTQLTKDHSFVQQLIDEGRITAEEGLHHPQRSIVTRVMTGMPDDEADLSMREATPGDRYLLCSDGLSDFVTLDAITEILTDAKTPEEAADRCIQIALKAGTRDNVTAIVADVVDVTAVGAPSDAPQVVGAAAKRMPEQPPTPAEAASPAEKAAALTRSVAPVAGSEAARAQADAAETELAELQLAEEHSRGGLAVFARRTGLLVVLAAVLGIAGYAGYTWSQSKYFLGDQDGVIALYRGVPVSVGPVSLNHFEVSSGVQLSNLPVDVQDSVRANLSVADPADAQAKFASLRQQELACLLQFAPGTSCGAVANPAGGPSVGPSGGQTTTVAPLTNDPPATTTPATAEPSTAPPAMPSVPSLTFPGPT